VKAKCYFCDNELAAVTHTFKIGMREEPVCDECFVKTVNRRKTKEQDPTG
jgi:hypothetical protein